MSAVVAVLVIVSSIGLSVALSRFAVGELFRLARIDARRHADDAASQ
jgi:hypothetical protein